MTISLRDTGLHCAFRNVSSDLTVDAADARALIDATKDGSGMSKTEAADLARVLSQRDVFITADARKILATAIQAPTPTPAPAFARVTLAAQSVEDSWRAPGILYPVNRNLDLPAPTVKTGPSSANPLKVEFKAEAGEFFLVFPEVASGTAGPITSDDDRPIATKVKLHPDRATDGYWVRGQRTLHDWRNAHLIGDDGIANRKNDYLVQIDRAKGILTITRYDEFYGTPEAKGREQCTRTVITRWAAPLPPGV